jgi:hypothetical protein
MSSVALCAYSTVVYCINPLLQILKPIGHCVLKRLIYFAAHKTRDRHSRRDDLRRAKMKAVLQSVMSMYMSKSFLLLLYVSEILYASHKYVEEQIHGKRVSRILTLEETTRILPLIMLMKGY